jgi:hypothetical protein
MKRSLLSLAILGAVMQHARPVDAFGPGTSVGGPVRRSARLPSGTYSISPPKPKQRNRKGTRK